MEAQRDMFGTFEKAERQLAQMSSPSRPKVNQESAASARQLNESVHHKAEALAMLRRGEPITDVAWKELFPGSRIAPTVEKLRNAHGFSILGDGSTRAPYHMPNRWQLPERIEVTEAIKQAYYDSERWNAIRLRRMQFDEYRCNQCRCSDDLQVHHFIYNLFCERLYELSTFCSTCHGNVVHNKQSRLAFPSGISVEHAKRLGFEPVFEQWLCVPKGLV